MKILDKSLEIAKALFPEGYKARSRYRAFHFSFIWKRGTLLSVGQNEVDTPNSKMVKFGRKFGVEYFREHPYIHAEIDAIARLWGRVELDNSMSVVVIRLNRDLSLKESRPCPNCTKVLTRLGLTTKLWHSTEQGIIRWTAKT